MKLFNQLLVAPAALGLLAPISAIASEVNISEIASYSEIDQVEEEIFDHNSFSSSLVSNSTTEGNYTNPATFEAGSFSETTVATQTAQFLIGAMEGEPSLDEEAIQAYYYYGLSLDTSFTGEDNLNVGIEAGNTNNAGFNVGTFLDFGTTAGDTLKVADINYTRSFGDLTVSVGDSLDASSQFTGACAYSGFTDHLSDCGTGLSAGLGGDVSLSSSYDFGNGLTAGFGITGAEGSTTDGLFTKESIDAYAIQLAYAADSYGVALTYSDIDSVNGGSGIGLTDEDNSIWGLNGYYTFDGPIESISVGYEMANPEGTDKDTTNWFAGVMTSEVGPGTISLGLGTTTHIAEDAEDTLYYEAAYSWGINDATDMTFGGFIGERTAGSGEDATGVALVTTFSF